MSQTITFDHAAGGWDLVAAEDLDGRESHGTKEVASPISAGGGTRTAHIVEAPLTRTISEFPDDYDDHPQAVVHFIATLVDQHAPADKITHVYGPAKLARKLAAMLDAEYGGETAPDLDDETTPDKPARRTK